MITKFRSSTAAISIFSALLAAGPSYAETKAAETAWYLVDEIIEDEAPDYRSDIFFADKASIKQEDGYTSVSISHIIMARSEIKDMRSRILIDCNAHIYAAMEVAEYDQDNKLVASKAIDLETVEWILPYANSGYVSVFRFACEPNIKFGSQKFRGDIQPLTSVMAYLNADWSN